jgi:hypothetical protein
MNNCAYCSNLLKKRNSKYCSNKCQVDFQYDSYIYSWKSGKATGERGVNAKGLSGHVRRYLMHKYKSACSRCGWSHTHEVTGKVPLEIDHIDGNAENNSEANLRLLCPNCHSLTRSYRNLNFGRGRTWRRAKYLKQL